MIIAETFLKLMADTKPQIQESQRTPVQDAYATYGAISCRKKKLAEQ